MVAGMTSYQRQHGNPEVYPARVRLSDISPYEGAATAAYMKGVEAISESLMRYNAVVIELGRNDAAIIRCGLEASRLFFRNHPLSRGLYIYRAGRAVEDSDSSPPCIAEVFRCLGKAARAALCAIARHLRLRTDVFNHLLDDIPLPINEASSSMLVATYIHDSMQTAKGAIGCGNPSLNAEFEKGLLTLISSDIPGLQVCDPNGRWYLADSGLGTSSVLLLTGKALSHSTAGLRPAATYRAASDLTSAAGCVGRTSFAFRLMPRSNAILDCSSISAAGHVIPHSYIPISVNQFMDELSAEDGLCNHSNSIYVEQNNQNKEVSLRSLLSDPISGSFLEDAMAVSCGHSFGGLMLRKVMESSRCSLCRAEIETRSMIPNLALRAAASVVRHEDDRKLFHNAALRKRRKEMGDQTDLGKRINKEMDDITSDGGQQRVIQYPFSVNEKVVIKGNRRTPGKFVGKEAVITSQCLNGWYLLKITSSGESVRLQYRSLQKLSASQTNEEKCTSEPIQTNS
ncbi:uncharacterized protein LOC141642719 [Silene latifolia]|uniref:uncharacterized protein LOC141642719 n=1 Tax=Silene latifolia TaxID=37657 RepID=UPI003D782DF7